MLKKARWGYLIQTNLSSIHEHKLSQLDTSLYIEHEVGSSTPNSCIIIFATSAGLHGFAHAEAQTADGSHKNLVKLGMDQGEVQLT